MKKVLLIVVQVILLSLFSLAGNFISKVFYLPISGSIIGLFLLFICLHFKIIKLSWVEIGAGFLLAELLLFFIPSAVGVIQYKSDMIHNGLKFIIIIVLSTLIVMLVTGFSAEFLLRRKERSKQ
ncbi:holin-like protein [Scopulibacillus daqui]|uniref:Holin-like protein n=1 Tax=Scopulibacillus daqui TaxID=1469162 RepID=A0ABS2Q0J8_9BACL|nr:CidA/LrgA family protein [Scopulibacillus daqui]MBM7645713.1 holin-like protein [Scopulibacillus daqui]